MIARRNRQPADALRRRKFMAKAIGVWEVERGPGVPREMPNDPKISKTITGPRKTMTVFARMPR
jgi:hypothetical protein